MFTAFMQLIKLYRAKLTNKTTGGEGASGLKHSAASKQKMSKVNKGKIRSVETCKKLSTISKNRSRDLQERMTKPRIGVPLSTVTKEKISKSHQGKKASLETKLKMSLARQGNKNCNYISGDFITYHLWAQEISGLRIKNYCLNKNFTLAAFAGWRFKFKRGLL